MSGTDRFMEYLGAPDWAKVEEHPFDTGMVSCMLLTEGHLKGRKLTPDEARELADHLIDAADQAELRSVDTGTEQRGEE